MVAPVKFRWKEQSLWLSRERCIYWEEENALILSDLHLGKSGHFRKSGIGIPQNVFKEDLHRLLAQVQFFKPSKLIIVGDLFHSTDNKEHELFLKWRKDLPQLAIHLVEGNHDILADSFYENAGIQLYTAGSESGCLFNMSTFSFIHDITAHNHSQFPVSNYIFSGHIHPGIRISGAGKQSLRFPCFYFGKDYAVLPAFGKFTGTYLVEPARGEHVFAILPGEDGGLMKLY